LNTHALSAVNPLIRVEGVTRTYRIDGREVPALRGVDLTVAQGELVSLRGRSGSGKTTLLNCIGGLDQPTSGKVWIEGREVTQLSESDSVQLRRKRIGFVFQSFALLPVYSAAENIDLMLRLAGINARGERRRRVEYVLTLVGLKKWADHRPYELSGGQQQRVAIARALVTQPALILADEPTGELDSATGQQIMELFREIVDREKTTVLIATHNLAVDMFADRVCLLEDGQIREERQGAGAESRSAT
jgi:ABC-type lipoprotein export system ATPase subunit